MVNQFRIRGRLIEKRIDTGTGDFTVIQSLKQILLVDDTTAGGVDQDRLAT